MYITYLLRLLIYRLPLDYNNTNVSLQLQYIELVLIFQTSLGLSFHTTMQSRPEARSKSMQKMSLASWHDRTPIDICYKVCTIYSFNYLSLSFSLSLSLSLITLFFLSINLSLSLSVSHSLSIYLFSVSFSPFLSLSFFISFSFFLFHICYFLNLSPPTISSLTLSVVVLLTFKNKISQTIQICWCFSNRTAYLIGITRLIL